MKFAKKMLAGVSFVFVCTASQAWVPNPNNNAAAFFQDGTFMSVPTGYFQSNGNSETLREKPWNDPNAQSVDQLWQWGYVFENVPNGIQYTLTTDGYPAYDETYALYRRQCVAFAKAVAGVSEATSHWYPMGNSVIPSNRFVTWDQSWMYAGRMVAYFGANPNPNVSFDAHLGAPNHVGIFLRYEYDGAFPANIIGFWIVDQNYEYDGKIRRRYVSWLNNDPTVNNAGNYYLVDIR